MRLLPNGARVSDIDDEFKVRLGRIGNRRGRKAISYVKRVGKIAQKAGIGTTHRTSGFTGSRIGRGYAQGTVSASRRSAGQRRVVIKARLVRIKAGNAGAVRAHLRYVQRDGVTREGNPGELYDEGHDRVDAKADIRASRRAFHHLTTAVRTNHMRAARG
ncbi:hypothetical protein V1283_005566 [Bradyrhizobium sp. AZCC 2262]